MSNSNKHIKISNSNVFFSCFLYSLTIMKIAVLYVQCSFDPLFTLSSLLLSTILLNKHKTHFPFKPSSILCCFLCLFRFSLKACDEGKCSFTTLKWMETAGIKTYSRPMWPKLAAGLSKVIKSQFFKAPKSQICSVFFF